MMYSKKQQLGKKRKKQSKNFTPKIKEEIFERDGYACVKCYSNRLENTPHHIIFKSQGGEGDKRNGATVCIECHRLAHSKREVRKWFEDWKENKLDDNGNYKEDF